MCLCEDKASEKKDASKRDWDGATEKVKEKMKMYSSADAINHKRLFHLVLLC